MSTQTPPIAIGPLDRLHREASATFEIVDGWEIAVSYPNSPQSNANAVVDASHIPTHEINGPHTGEMLAALCGQDVSVRSIAVQDDRFVYRLTPSRAIVFGKCDVPEALDVTGGWATLALFGADARTILNKICSLDLRETTLPVGCCCQGPMFGVGVLLGRFENRYELHACPDTLAFLWEVIFDAGREFGLQPAGWEFYRQHLTVLKGISPS